MVSYVYVKNPNGKTYVYENSSYWDKTEKKSRHKRRCIGHLDPMTNKIIPNHQKKVIESLVTPICTVTNIGISLLVDKAAASTGILPILHQVFPDDWDKLLTCAYYLVSEGGALCHAEKWSSMNVIPFCGQLADQRISELLIRLTPSLQQEFFSKWIAHNAKEQYFALDITSISSYSDANDVVRYGYNQDGEDLPQINLLLVTGEKSHLPVCFQVVQGSIKDVSTLQTNLDRMDFLDARRLHMVIDKGFYSEANVDALYENHHRFMVEVPFTVALAKKVVEENREEMDSYKNYCRIFDDEIYAVSKLISWKGHRCYVHVYYDSFKAEVANKKLGQKLLAYYEELTNGVYCKEHRTYYEKFFKVKETPKRERKVTYNDEAIREYKKNQIGWFVMITNDIKDSVKALEIYRQKEAVEKSFDNLKNDLDRKRLRVHSNAAMEGRLFVQFIALILTTYLKTVMNENGWFESHDLQDVLSEIKSLRKVQVEGTQNHMMTTLTSFQKEIVALFHLRV